MRRELPYEVLSSRGPLLFPSKYLVGRGVQVGIPAPDHVLAQFAAHDLHLVLLELGTLGVEEGAAVFVLGDPLAREGAVLDVGEHRAHPGLGLLVGDDPGAADILAVLGGVGDGVVHSGHAALVDEVNDELHLVDALEVGVLRLVPGLHQHLEAAAHQVHHAAAQHGLLAEQVGLRLVVEGGLHHARPGAADARDVGQGNLVGVAGGVLLHGHQAGHALAGDVGGAHGVAGALGGGHEHVYPGGGDDLLVADIEAMGKSQGLALGHIGGDVLFIDLGLHLVVDQDHDDIRPLSGGGDGLDRQPGLLGVGPVLGALPQADADIAAGVLQVEGVGVALGAVADDGDLLALQPAQVAVLLIVHLCHVKTLLVYDKLNSMGERFAEHHITTVRKRMITVIQSQNVFAQVELIPHLVAGVVADGGLAALQGHHAGAHQLQDAELGQQLLQRVVLGLLADDGQGQALGGHVDDGGAEDVGDLDHLVAHLTALRLHLDEHQLPADGRLRRQQPHRIDGELLAQLVDDLVDLGFGAQHLNGDTGHRRVVGGAHRQGLDVVALAGEQPGHLAEYAGGVLHQDGQGVALDSSCHGDFSPLKLFYKRPVAGRRRCPFDRVRSESKFFSVTFSFQEKVT